MAIRGEDGAKEGEACYPKGTPWGSDPLTPSTVPPVQTRWVDRLTDQGRVGRGSSHRAAALSTSLGCLGREGAPRH